MNDFKRSAGILLHITSLPGEGFVGTLDEAAFRFVDFLADTGHKVWQILPIGPPARGNSPYSALSAFAGNPLFISPRKLREAGLLPTGSHIPAATASSDYDEWAAYLLPLLRLSFQENAPALADELSTFSAVHKHWLPEYAHFMALRDVYGSNFRDWPKDLFLRNEDALSASREALAEEIAFHKYVQYLFFSQWEALRAYARERGVLIFGDVPIYVDIESADLWANPSLFDLNEDYLPRAVAGVPPDAFTEEGQLWGNPLYDWAQMRVTGYDWWIRRLRHAGTLCDILRMDHFRGLESYWAIPAAAASAKCGAWQKGPGIDFLNVVRAALPDCRLVAEDLGYLDDAVHNLLRESGLPGVAVLEFAFSHGEQSGCLPHQIAPDRVTYIGTHDNDTAVGWLASGPSGEVDHARNYLNIENDTDFHWKFLEALYGTRANLVIAQMQDILGLGSEARMNIPSQSEGSWVWRLTRIPEDLIPRLHKMIEGSNRI